MWIYSVPTSYQSVSGASSERRCWALYLDAANTPEGPGVIETIALNSSGPYDRVIIKLVTVIKEYNEKETTIQDVWGCVRWFEVQ